MTSCPEPVISLKSGIRHLNIAIGAVIGLGLILWSLRFERGHYDMSRHTLGPPGAGGIGVLYAVVFAVTLYYEFITKTHGFFMLAVISATAFAWF